jgi:hypothetical protein
MSLRARIKRLEARIPPVESRDKGEIDHEPPTDEEFDLWAEQILQGQIPADDDLTHWARERLRVRERWAARAGLTHEHQDPP